MRKHSRVLTSIAWLPHRYPLAVYVLFLAGLAVGIAEGSSALVSGAARPVARLMRLGDRESHVDKAQSASAVLETGDLWLEGVKSTFRRMERGGSMQSSLGAPLPPPAEGLLRSERRIGGTHRTMCVRLCDGYYFPISYATTRDRFDDDERTCQQSCSSPARLYAYPNPGGEPDDMVSIRGEAYSKLPNAFKFRQAVDQSCKCNAHPWEAEATARHQRYAEEASRKQKQQVAAAEASVRNRAKSMSQPAAVPPQSPLVAKVSPVAPETMRPLTAVSGGSAAKPIMLNSASLPGQRNGATPKSSEGERRGTRARSANVKSDGPMGQADARPAKRSDASRFADSRDRVTAQR